MNNLKREYYNTDLRILVWEERSENGKEQRREYVHINLKDGEVVVIVEHVVNGIIDIERRVSVPLSTAIGAEVQDKLTKAEIEDVKAAEEINNEESNRINNEFNNVINGLTVVEEDIEFKATVNESECPEWLEEKKYFYEAARLGFIRPFGCGNKWTKEQIKKFYVEFAKILIKHKDKEGDWELQDDMLILLLRCRRDFTNITAREDGKHNDTDTPVKIAKNIYQGKIIKGGKNYSKNWYDVLYDKDFDETFRAELTKSGNIPYWNLESNKIENYEEMRKRYGIKNIK